MALPVSYNTVPIMILTKAAIATAEYFRHCLAEKGLLWSFAQVLDSAATAEIFLG